MRLMYAILCVVVRKDFFMKVSRYLKIDTIHIRLEQIFRYPVWPRSFPKRPYSRVRDSLAIFTLIFLLLLNNIVISY